MDLAVRVIDALTSYSDEQLDRATRHAGVFLDRRWLRMLDAIDLEAVLGGGLHKRYVAVIRDAELIALCPFIVTRSESIYSFYSLDKFYFTSWKDELVQMNPDSAGFVRWIGRMVSAYRWLACATGASTQGWVLGVSPVSYHFDIATAPMTADVRSAVHDKVLDALKDVASEEGLPLCLMGVREAQQELRGALDRHRFTELFLTYDSAISLSSVASFSEFLGQFPSDARRRFKREMEQVESADVHFESAGKLADVGGALEALYEATYGKYGDERFRHPQWFWTAVDRHLGGMADVLVAYLGQRPIGFSALLHKGEDLHFWRVGRSSDDALADIPLYFSLAVYEPVKRALAVGARHVWLGPGSWQAKRRRGASQHACYSYMWFPRRWSRCVLNPYLRTFSRISQVEQAAASAGNKR